MTMPGRSSRKSDKLEIPEISQIESELKREKHKGKYNRTLRSTIYSLIVVAAVAVLVATVFMPVLRIYGSSMAPTIGEGEIVVSLKGADFTCGDVIGFYYGNKLLVKRVIAGPGQWVDMDEEGNVSVNGQPLDEPYITDKAYGDVNIELPYQVPDGKYFVMGDHRSTSADSRNTAVGCIADEQIVGRIVFRVWPLNRFGTLNGDKRPSDE